MHQTVALDIVRRSKTTPIHELERYMRCSDCPHTLQRRRYMGPLHIGLGGEFVPPQFRHFYKGNLITGVFSLKTNVKGAAEARERLFKTPEAARAALAGWPLGTPDILNARPSKTSEDLRKLAEAMSNLTVSESAALAKPLKERWQLT
jgi:hypothetical protein